MVGKLTYLIAGKIFKRDSFLPGVIALKLNKNILYDFKLPKTVIAVTGSSGKGSTTSIMTNVYKNLGYKVCYNDKDSNQVSAIITSLLENSKLNGKVKSDVCIFEMGERYAIQVFPNEVYIPSLFTKENILGFNNHFGSIYKDNIKLDNKFIFNNNFYGTYTLGLLPKNPSFTKYFIKQLIINKNKKFKIKDFNFKLDKKAYTDFITFKSNIK